MFLGRGGGNAYPTLDRAERKGAATRKKGLEKEKQARNAALRRVDSEFPRVAQASKPLEVIKLARKDARCFFTPYANVLIFTCGAFDYYDVAGKLIFFPLLLRRDLKLFELPTLFLQTQVMMEINRNKSSFTRGVNTMTFHFYCHVKM